MNRLLADRMVVLVLYALGMLAIPAPAYARPVMLRSEPADGALLSVPPRRIRVWLSETADLQPETLRLVDGNGQVMSVTGYAEFYQPVTVGLADKFDAFYLYLCSVSAAALPTVLTVELPDLAPGSYQLSWQASALRNRTPIPGTLVFAIHPGARPSEDDTLPGDLTLQNDDLLATVRIRPNIPGQNFIGLTVVSTRRPAPAPIERVRLRVTGPDRAPHAIELGMVGEGRWQVASDSFDQPGDWRIEVLISRQGLADTLMSSDWRVPPPPPALQPTNIAVLLLGFALGTIVVVRLRHGRQH